MCSWSLGMQKRGQEPTSFACTEGSKAEWGLEDRGCPSY